jgi:hypothetical protein
VAVNRYRRNLPVLDPTLYQYTPQQIQPDLTGFGDMLAGMQKVYDSSFDIPIPKHIPLKDENLVKELYLDPIKQLRDQATESFVSAGTPEGLRKMKDLERMVKELKQPGGTYDLFEQNYDKYLKYNEEIDKMDVRPEKKETLKRLSMDRFKGSFVEGAYSPFSGIGATKDLNLHEPALKIAQGWKADQVASGTLMRDSGGTGFLYASTKKYVDPREVKHHVKQALSNDTEIVSYLRQEAMLRGLEGEEAGKFIDKQLDDAAALAAAKEGFTERDVKHYQDWQMKQGRDHAFEWSMAYPEKGTGRTGYISVETGAAKMKLDGSGRIPDEKHALTEARPMTAVGSVMRSPSVVTKDAQQYTPIEERVKDPEFLSRYPGSDRLIQAMPRERYPTYEPVDPADPTKGMKLSPDRNKIETDAEYESRISKAYNEWTENLSQTYLQYQGYDDQQMTRATDELLNTMSHRSHVLLHPDRPPENISYEDALALMGGKRKTPADIRKEGKVSVVGEQTPESAVAPDGYVYTIKDGRKEYTLVASNTTEESAMYSAPYWRLMQPGHNLKTNRSGWEVIDTGADASTGSSGRLLLRSESEVVINEQGIPENKLVFYQATGVGPDGQVMGERRTDMTKEELMFLHTENPFAPRKTNPRLSSGRKEAKYEKVKPGQNPQDE